MAEIIDNVKDFIFKYAEYINLGQMSPAVRARFKEYEERHDFTADMGQWPDIFAKINANDWPELNDSNYEKLFHLFQPVFERMAQSVTKDREAPKAVKIFVNKWYGTNKLFTQSAPNVDTQNRIDDFVLYLESNQNSLRAVFTDKTVGDGFNFNTFITDIKNRKYLTDFGLREQLKVVANYVQNIANGNSWYDWPDNLRPYDFSKQLNGLPAISINVEDWFESHYHPGFKRRLPEIFGELVGNKKVFEYFQKNDNKNIISGQISEAIKKTNYADPNSDNYVPEKDSDEKNLFQRIDDRFNKIKENQIDPWINILRGTRRFFTNQAKSIIEACSKVKTKDGKVFSPTDGLKGILDNKDAITRKIQTSPTARAHWKWISEKLAKYSENLPKAFEGALRNPRQLRKIVSKFIIDAVQEGKIDEAKTALEMISTLKYGIAHSRTVNALKKQEFNTLSDKGLSWNNYEIGRFISGGLDWGIKTSILGVGRGIAMVHNKWMRDNTKFNGKDGFLKSAHGLWKENNDKNKYITNVNNEIDADLTQARADYATKRTALLSAGGSNVLPNARQNIQHYISSLQQNNDSDLQTQNSASEILKRRRAMLGQDPNAYRAQLNTEIQDMDTDLQRLNQDKSVKMQEADRLEHDIDVWNTKLQAMDPTDTSFAGVAGYKMALENKLAMLQGEINQLDSNIVSTENNKSEKEQQKNDLTPAALQALQDKIDRLGVDINARNTDIKNQQKILNDFDNANFAVKGLVQQKHDIQSNVDGWDDAHKDKYIELMGFWDMVETFRKSHQLTFAADKMRNKFIKSGKAKHVELEFLEQYKNRYSNAA